MAEKYIPLSAALKAFEDVEDLYSPEQGNTRYSPTDVEEILNDIPPADVRPVVRGNWEPYEFEIRPYIHGKPMWAQCSVCGKATRCREEPYTSSYTGETIIVERILNFCPNCGADMRPEPEKEDSDV